MMTVLEAWEAFVAEMHTKKEQRAYAQLMRVVADSREYAGVMPWDGMYGVLVLVLYALNAYDRAVPMYQPDGTRQPNVTHTALLDAADALAEDLRQLDKEAEKYAET